MPLIVFEDEDLLVVNKPVGWNTHAPSPFAGEGVYDWLKHREPRWSRLAIIHRLDKETSGVLVFGKTAAAIRALTQQFASRAVRKKYLLLTDRPVKGGRFTALSTIVRAAQKYVSRPLRSENERAETSFTACRQFATARPKGESDLPVANRQHALMLVEAEPITGRTHQIRVHAAQYGFPILGDTLYGGTKAERVFLHAAELSLKHPTTGEPVTFRAPCNWTADGPAREFVIAECAERAVHTGDPLRTAVIDPEFTNAFRIVHGGSDGWAGFYVDKLADWLLVQSEHGPNEGRKSQLQELALAYRARGIYHKLLSRNVRRSKAAESSPQLLCGDPAPARFTIRENGLAFELSFNEGYSVGLFLDQRDNRRRFLINYVGADFGVGVQALACPPLNTLKRELQPEVLNAFAYTCGFSVAAAKAGARVTSLDLSKKYLEWGRRNFALNTIDPSQHDFIYGEAFDWLRRLHRKRRVFDCIVLDPPTFSQSKESGTWQAEKDYGRLIESALLVLKANGVLFASTNAAKLPPEEFLASIEQAVKRQRRKIVQQYYVPQPPDFPISRPEPAYLKTVWLRVA
jgi:23S rRNA (cytosine1962-C5)-methyltransferase